MNASGACDIYKCWAAFMISSFCWKSECFWKVSSKAEISPVQAKAGLVQQVLTSGNINNEIRSLELLGHQTQIGLFPLADRVVQNVVLNVNPIDA